ncbi:MAG: SRPBCC domain-containing protein [Pseudomonadota bacterium]
MHIELIKTVVLKAPTGHVWRFLTERDKLATWFHEGKADLVPDQPWVLVTNSQGKEGEPLLWGDIECWEPPSENGVGRLTHTFTHDWLKGPPLRCDWRLTPAGAGCVLTLTHTGFDGQGGAGFAEAADTDRGWDDHFVRLRTVVSW